MARLRPVGIPEEDKIEPHTKIIPDRVQKLMDLYAKNHVEYPWTETDKLDQVFEYRKTLRPDTYKYDIESIYRVRDPHDRSKEYYFYQMKGRVDNDNKEPEHSSALTYGFAVEKEHELKWNSKIKSKEPVRMRDNPTYFYEWNKSEVKKLLDGSEKQCLNFYIGYAGTQGQGDTPITNVLSVKDVNDFLDGGFEDLAVLNKSGLMGDFGPSLHLLDKARKKLEDKAIERVDRIDSGDANDERVK
jgi:hypothetical protein